jgi:excisionase family DNA binding protein
MTAARLRPHFLMTPTFFPPLEIDWPAPLDFGPDDDLLRPREVAAMLGVRTATIARWARDGLLKSTVLTPGGHRRYRRADVCAAQQATGTSEEPDPEQQRMTQDAVRLYDQGWPIRLVAAQFGLGYGPMVAPPPVNGRAHNGPEPPEDATRNP